MAGPFYVDISDLGDWATHDGTNTTTSAWRGFTGLQKAFDSANPGETVYIKGSASDASKLYTVTYDANSGTTLTNGEEVTWDTGEGAWADGSDKGIVYWTTDTTAGTTVLIELTVGTMPADNDVIKGTTSGNTITRATTANANATLTVGNKAGTNAAGHIKYIGCTDDAGYTVNGDRAYLDFKDITVHGITFLSTADMLWFENIEIDEVGAARNGWEITGVSSEGLMFVNCCAHDCGQDGFNPLRASKMSTFFRCVSYLNGRYGFSAPNSESKLLFCCARDNSNDGFQPAAQADYIGCVAHNNASDGFQTYSCLHLNCVADSNTEKGFNISDEGALRFTLMIGNRITNHSGTGDIGMECTSGPVVYGWNAFDTNKNHINGEVANVAIPLSLENTTTDSNDFNNEDGAGGGDTNQGYAEAVSEHNFSTGYTDATDPDNRRVAITIPWT